MNVSTQNSKDFIHIFISMMHLFIFIRMTQSISTVFRNAINLFELLVGDVDNELGSFSFSSQWIHAAVWSFLGSIGTCRASISLLSNPEPAECLCVAAPWGKRGWKTFYSGLRGMVLYLQKVSNSVLLSTVCFPYVMYELNWVYFIIIIE